MLFTDIIFFPIIHLIIEYLDLSNNCICNNQFNDLLSIALVNKELYNYLINYNIEKPTRILYYSITNLFTTNYFKIKNICVKHHLLNDTTYIHDILNVFKRCYIEEKVMENKNYLNRDWVDITKRNNAPNKLKKKNKKKIIDYIHCKNIDACKQFLNNYCKNICIRYSCCGGEGFSIEIDMLN